MENDVLGARIWGPPSQPTLSLGKSDIWDRRWFGDRQPLITLARIRELAMADRLTEVAKAPNNTVYDIYNRYPAPCPKAGVQLILGTPFARNAIAEQRGREVRLALEGVGKRLQVGIRVHLARLLIMMEFESSGLRPGDLWVRVYRHRDTIQPGALLTPGLMGDHPIPEDLEQLPLPRTALVGAKWGILQDFGPDPTFPAGFRFAGLATAAGAVPGIVTRTDEAGLGTPLWATREGHLSHGFVKRYTPINEASGAAATAEFADIPKSFAVLVTLLTSQDDADPVGMAVRTLDDAVGDGIPALKRSDDRMAEARKPRQVARAHMGGRILMAAPESTMPSLRVPGGYYGDVPLCTVGSTKFCFQDASPWHADFHFNEIRAEPMLTLARFEELMPYCEMIHTLLAQARENAEDVYGLPGAMYPLVHFPIRCRGVAHVNLTWEQDMGLNGLVSKPLWLYYRYTTDRAFLKRIAYPVLRECARFMASYLQGGSDGYLHIEPTVSPEHWGLTPRFERNRDCTSALALTRYLLLAAASAAGDLRRDQALAGRWRKAAARLAPYPIYASHDGPVWVDVADAPPIEYNIPVPLSPVFWGDHVGLDSDQGILELAKRTLGQINVWEPHRSYLDTSVRPRLGIHRPGAAIAPESLLLSYQSIHVFHAAPPNVEITMEDFAAEGGFRICASRTAENEVSEFSILSSAGGDCMVANPWPGKEVRVVCEGGDLGAFVGDHIAFKTRKGMRYELKPV